MNDEDKVANELDAKIAAINESLTALRSFVDTNDMQVREILATLTSQVGDLQKLMYGATNLRLVGLVDTCADLKKKLDTLEGEKVALQNKVKGFQYAISILGLGSATTAIGVILKLFQ